MSQQLSEILDDAIAHRIFPGAVVYLSKSDHVLMQAAFGSTAYGAEYSKPVSTRTLYDLASITKLFTTTAFLIAARENGAAWSTPVAHFLPAFKTSDKSEITLCHLLQHNSGIEIAIQSLIEISPKKWIEKIADADLKNAPGAGVLYSCTNFFLLARIIEKWVGAPLDEFIVARVLQPLDMERATYFPLKNFVLDEIAPTEIDNGILRHGVVHDEAARAWLEYSGRASCGNSGLFGTAEDVAKFCQLWLGDGSVNGQQILQRDEIERALTNTVPEEKPVARRGLGWQLDCAAYMSEKSPPASAGHAGFTGPTLWLNRSTQHLCIVLNNRVYPSREGENRFPIHREIARLMMK